LGQVYGFLVYSTLTDSVPLSFDQLFILTRMSLVRKLFSERGQQRRLPDLLPGTLQSSRWKEALRPCSQCMARSSSFAERAKQNKNSDANSIDEKPAICLYA
jgi:hypothetical protein